MKNHILLSFSALLLLSSGCSDKTRFELLDPAKTGVIFENTVEESDSLHVINFEYIYNGAGVGVADLNNDGRQDLLFTGNQVAPEVYLNEGDFRFTNISGSFEDLDGGQWYSGVTFVDINSDGWMDVYLTCTAYDDSIARRNRFYINQGVGEDGSIAFVERAAQYGLDDDSYSVHAAFFDYDLDGDLDLYLLNNYVNERLSASYRKKILDGSAASNDDLYRNNGDGTFTNVTIEAGIVFEGFGLGLALSDVNKDGYPDIYVSNDYVSNDLLYINQGDGTFRNLIDTYLSYQTKSSMGNDIADANNDGNPDIYTLDMLPEYYHKKKQTINGFGYVYYTNDERFGYEHQYLRNMLHMHNGFTGEEMIPFSEVGQMMGVYQSEWSWSPLFADFDNDGDKDLVISNGYPRDMTDKDWTMYKAEVYGSVAGAKHVISRLPSLKVHNYAFVNQDGKDFIDRSEEWFGDIPSYSYGAVFADLDEDGDLDYVVNNLNDKAFIFRNTTADKAKEENNYLRIKLNGSALNSQALGAKVEIWSDGGYQFQENWLARGYISSVEPVIHFGLASGTTVDTLRVTWPGDQLVTLLTGIEANQLLELSQTDAKPIGDVDPFSSGTELFVSEESVIDYVHQQNDFIDFYYRQVILPHKFSQIGPCMQKGDLNNDGMEDLVIGATNTLPTTVYLNTGEGFLETEMEGLSGLKVCSESGISIFDVDQDGDNDVITLSGGYEQEEESYIHYLYRNENGSFIRSPLPTDPFIANVVRPFDFDHDGDMDLFIGARIKKEMFPLANDSWILINQDGSYEEGNTLNFNLGMVTDAVWSDYNGDGWEDLFIAREWNSAVILQNVEGQRLTMQEIPEIEEKHGIWNSISEGDFDGDGDPDYILGNLGENHRFTISDEYPLRIYAFDLDLNGTLDPLSTGYWKDQYDVMREYPINYLDELIGQSQFFMNKFRNYTSFSYASIGEILDTAMRNRINAIFHTNTASSYVVWNRDEGFVWEKLPHEAQMSPIKQTLVRDLNGDGLPDVILAGNDHTYDVGTGYYDANKGLILMSSEGEPLADLLPASESGLMLNGMVESLLFLEGDTPLLVAGSNREPVVTYRMRN